MKRTSSFFVELRLEDSELFFLELAKQETVKIAMAAGGNTNDQKIKDMYETVLNHAGDWARARTTHLVCKIEGDDVPIVKTNVARRDGNVHAEKLLIDDLQGNDTVNETNGSSGADPDLSEDLKKMSLDESKKKATIKKPASLSC